MTDTLTTPALPKPFKRVKSIGSKPFALSDQPGQFARGTYVVYMNPRGDITFAIGVPSVIANFLGKHPEKGPYIAEQDGAHYVEAPTAEAVVSMLVKLMNHYSEAWGAAHKREVIVFSFQGTAPYYAEDGSAVRGGWAYKPTHTSFGGSAGQQTSVELSFIRRWQIGQYLYCLNSEGELERDRYNHGGEANTLPFTEETWNELVRVRDTLTKAVVLLGDVFESDDVPKALTAMRFPALAAPEPA